MDYSKDPAPNQSPGEGITKCEEFWFDDGNIVLVARNTSFRVHKGFLRRQSPVFNDIQLSDSREDIHHMLSVLYDGGNKYFGSKTAPRSYFSTQRLLSDGWHFLESETFTDCRSTEDEDEDSDPPTFLPIEMIQKDVITVVRLATMFDLTNILPSAYYACAQMSPAVLIKALVDGQ
ncbi:hypothetical protein C8Q75DRAFT_806691 [Abortiporus biennis]|nr:hypothetical protein C8Q75DRAFT_806691 [Abortiporus biennis]